jgi:hypothetical protein
MKRTPGFYSDVQALIVCLLYSAIQERHMKAIKNRESWEVKHAICSANNEIVRWLARNES